MMRLTDEQIFALQVHMHRNAPNIDRPVERESRRIEGLVETGRGDARGYRGVIAYIQRGLGGELEIVEQVLRKVVMRQNQYKLKYPVCLLSFGWDDGRLHHAGQMHQANYYSNYLPWARELSELAGVETPDPAAVIPALFPLADPYGRKRDVERHDLLLFFCRSRDVRMESAARERYEKYFTRYAVWVFCGEEAVEVEVKKFVPGSQQEQSKP